MDGASPDGCWFRELLADVYGHSEREVALTLLTVYATDRLAARAIDRIIDPEERELHEFAEAMWRLRLAAITPAAALLAISRAFAGEAAPAAALAVAAYLATHHGAGLDDSGFLGEVIAELAAAGARFSWYQHGADTAATVTNRTGLDVTVHPVDGQHAWTLAHRELLEVWRERIAAHVERFVHAKWGTPLRSGIYRCLVSGSPAA